MPVTRPTCVVCSAAGLVRPSDVEAGWFACRYCGSPSAMEGAGAAATEGPGGRVVCIGRAGHTRIEAREGNLLPPEAVLASVFAPGMASSG